MPDPMAQVAQVSTVVLYDPETGAIAHVHQETTLVGAVPSTAAQLERAAKRIFARQQPAANQSVASLMFNGSARTLMCPGATYKVVNCALVQG